MSKLSWITDEAIQRLLTSAAISLGKAGADGMTCLTDLGQGTKLATTPE